MEALRDFAREQGPLLSDLKAEHRSIHGIEVDFEPTWLALWQLRRLLSDSAWADVENTSFLPPHTPGAVSPWLFAKLGAERQTDAPRDRDEAEGFTSELWNRVTNENALASPFVVRLVLVPGTPDVPLPEDTTVKILRTRRPLARATGRLNLQSPLVGGVSVGTVAGQPTGTLGGVLQDDQGSMYALSCAHVLRSVHDEVKQPSIKDDASAARRVGEVVEVSDLIAGQPCRVDEPDINKVDAALVKLDVGITAALEVLDIGAVDGVGEAIAREPVEVSGKHGLHQPLYVGPLGALYDIVIDRTRHCFADLLTLTTLNSCVHPIQHGDSGAWVIRDGDEADNPTREWCGVVVARDDRQAYALRSAQVMSWLAGKGYALTCA